MEIQRFNDGRIRSASDSVDVPPSPWRYEHARGDTTKTKWEWNGNSLTIRQYKQGRKTEEMIHISLDVASRLKALINILEAEARDRQHCDGIALES